MLRGMNECSVMPAVIPPSCQPVSPSVIPAVFRGNPQAVIVAAGGTSQTAGFPINDVGNDSRRALSFRSCCRAVVFRAHWPARSLLACPPSFLACPPLLLSFPPPSSVIPAVFSGNPQAVIVADGGTSKTAGFPINDVGNDSRRALSFRSSYCRAVVFRARRPARSLLACPFPLLSFPQFLGGIHRRLLLPPAEQAKLPDSR